MLPPLNVPCDMSEKKKDRDAEFCVSKSSNFICVVGSNAISDHQIHVDSDDKGRDLKGWKGRKLRIPHENFATCICFFLNLLYFSSMPTMSLFSSSFLCMPITRAYDPRTSLIVHRSSFIAPPPTPYKYKHTYGHILCKYKLLFFFRTRS